MAGPPGPPVRAWQLPSTRRRCGPSQPTGFLLVQDQLALPRLAQRVDGAVVAYLYLSPRSEKRRAVDRAGRGRRFRAQGRLARACA